MYSFRKSKKGFTLIELMVVVAIIGILALLGLRLYIGQQRRAKDAISIANAATIHTLIQANLVDQTYTGDDAGADAAIDGAIGDGTWANDTNTANLRNPYDGTAGVAVAGVCQTVNVADIEDSVVGGDATGYVEGTVYVCAYDADSLFIRAVGIGVTGVGPVWIGNVLTALK